MKRKRRTKVTPEILKRMGELREKGLTYRNIASELDLSPMTVYKRLKAGKRVGFFERVKRKFR